MPVDVEARVIRNTRLSPDYNVIALAAPEIAAAAAPGQFVMVKPGRGHDPLLRRPFSVFEVPARSAGARRPASHAAQQAHRRDHRACSSTPSKATSCRASGRSAARSTLVDPPAEAWMVAGGVGLAPFATLTEALLRARHGRPRCSTARARERALLSRLVRVTRRPTGARDRGRQRRRARPRHGAARARAAAGERGTTSWCTPAARSRCSRRWRTWPRRHGRPCAGVGGARDGLRHGRLLQLRDSGARSRRRPSLRAVVPWRAGVQRALMLVWD